jgi:predicted aspartyl protease
MRLLDRPCRHRISTVLALGILGLLVAGVPAHSQFVGPRISPDCHLTKQAEVPIEYFQRHYVTTVSLNGHRVRMMIDTGASKSALLFDEIDAQHPVLINSIKVGDLEWLDVTVTGLASTSMGAGEAPVGLLGADILSQYDVEFDFPKGTMTFWSVARCGDRFVPWQGRFSEFHPQRTGHNAFVIPATINGHQLQALLDTGSDATSVTYNAALAAGVTPDAIELDRAGTRKGARGVALTSHVHRFDSMSIGPMTFRNAGLVVVDDAQGDFDMLLGIDFMRWRKVWFSYATNQVFMQWMSPPSPPGGISAGGAFLTTHTSPDAAKGQAVRGQ